jgi:hypothetical protein
LAGAAVDLFCDAVVGLAVREALLLAGGVVVAGDSLHPETAIAAQVVSARNVKQHPCRVAIRGHSENSEPPQKRAGNYQLPESRANPV